MSGKKPPRQLPPKKRDPVVPRPRPSPPSDREPEPPPPTPPPPKPLPQQVIPLPGAPPAPDRRRGPPPEPRVLTVPGAPMPRATTRRNPRRPMGIGALVLVLSMVALAVVLLARDTDDGAPAPEGRGRVPPSPVALAPDTSYVATRVRPNGALVVQHWIRSDVPVFGVTLEVPPAGGGRLAARGVHVYADGTQISGDGSLQRSGAFYPALGAEDLYVRYRLVGAVVRSGSTPGRALARVTALHIGLSRPLKLVTRAVMGDVLALACVPPGVESRPVPVPCGSPAANGWQVDLEGDRVEESVQAQLDLP